jgi:hypothetical protein
MGRATEMGAYNNEGRYVEGDRIEGLQVRVEPIPRLMLEIGEAEIATGVPEFTLNRFIRAGKLPVCHFGGDVELILVEDLMALARSLRSDSPLVDEILDEVWSDKHDTTWERREREERERKERQYADILGIEVGQDA